MANAVAFAAPFALVCVEAVLNPNVAIFGAFFTARGVAGLL